jgi:uncharacterized protein (DUF488 family)
MSKKVVEPVVSYKITVAMTNCSNAKISKTYKFAKHAAEHYSSASTLNWDYGVRKKTPRYKFNHERYHAYKWRLYHRVLPIFQQFMK